MKKTIKITILTTVFLFFSIFCFCQNRKTVTVLPLQKKELSEGEAYKMLYDNQVKANDSILKTIFYALGGLGTALILVFASNWWFNDKKVRDIVNEIDKKVKEHNQLVLAELNEKINTFSTEKTNEMHIMQTKLQDEVTNNIKSLTLKFTDFTENIRLEIKKDDKDLTKTFQKQLEVFNENYRIQIESIRENMNFVNENMNNLLNGKEETLKTLIETEKQITLTQFNSIKSELYRTKFYMWEARGVYTNAFRAQLDELEILIERKLTSLEFYLDQMLETVEKIKSLSKFDSNRAIEIMNLISDREVLAKELIEKINNITIE